MNEPKLEIRRLVFADLPNVIAIERRAFPTPWSLAMFVLELSKPEGICLAAQRDGHLAGYIICSRFDQVWHIMNVSVDPDVQRQGIASAMIDQILRRVGQAGRITLEVRPTNSAAIALYEGFGFLAAGTRPRYYQDNGEDAVIMWRTQATLRGELDDVPVAPARPIATP